MEVQKHRVAGSGEEQRTAAQGNVMTHHHKHLNNIKLVQTGVCINVLACQECWLTALIRLSIEQSWYVKESSNTSTPVQHEQMWTITPTQSMFEAGETLSVRDCQSGSLIKYDNTFLLCICDCPPTLNKNVIPSPK